MPRFLSSCCVNQVCFYVKKATQSVAVPIMAFKHVRGAQAKLPADVDLSLVFTCKKAFLLVFKHLFMILLE